MVEVDKNAVDGLVQVTKWLSTLLVTGSSVCLVVIILRFLNKPVFRLGQLEIPLHLLPAAIAAMTVAHAYLTWLLHVKVENLLALGDGSAKQAWDLVHKSGSLIFNGMNARAPYDTKTPLGIVYATNISDPTFWLNLCFAVAVLIGIVICRVPANTGIWHMRTLDSLVLGLMLALGNWLIGSHWAIQLSGLAWS